MKSDSLMSLLVALLFANTAATALLSYQYVSSILQQQRIVPQLARDQQEQFYFKTLWNEAMEYSKNHPEIRPLLQPLGLKTNLPAASGRSAAVKPPVK